MKMPRRKTMLALSAAAVGALVIVASANQFLFVPASRLDEQARTLDRGVRQADADAKRREHDVQSRLADLRRRTLGTDEAAVGEAMRARLMGLLAPAGLNIEQFLSPAATAQKIYRKTNDREVSRNITIKAGKLSHAVNLLYILACEPYVHRVDSISLKPSQERGRVELQFRYSTLALDANRGPRPAASQASSAPIAIASLDTPLRQAYSVIEDRDILRPYEKRRPPEAVPQPQPQPSPQAQLQRPTQEPEEARWRVAGLATYSGTDVVQVRGRGGEIRSFKVGESLMDGKVVLLDCRELPRHDNPKEFSPGRVILQVKDTYWAIEQGDRLADKHRLSPAELPPELRAPATAPASE
jgi:hypothetical protein